MQRVARVRQRQLSYLFQACLLEVLHEAVYFVVFLTIDVCGLHHHCILESVLCA